MEKEKVIKFGSKKAHEKSYEDAVKNSSNARVQNGTIETLGDNKIYKNDYFGLEITVPGDWITLESNELYEMVLENIKRLNVTESQRRKILEGITSDNISLFRATPFPTGTKELYGKNREFDNPTINCTAQKITMYPNSTASEFIEGMIEHLKDGSMGIKYDMVSDIHPVIISGKRFDSIDGKALINGGRDTVYTTYYSILKKGYQLSIIATCTSEEGLRDLNEIVNNIKLD